VLDTSFPAGDLARYYPENSEIVDFSKTGGHVQLFDQIVNYPHQDYIIDLQSDLLIKFFDIFNEIEFASGLEEQGMRAVVYYIVDANESSYEMAVETYARTPSIEFYPVYNQAVEPDFDLKHISRSAGRVDPLREVEMPKFSPELIEFLNQPGFDLSEFILGNFVHEVEAMNSDLMDKIKVMYENREVDSKGFLHVI